MPPTAYVLNQPLVAHCPTRWHIHARYALRLPGETLELPAGTWFLALPTDGGDVPHYRLADGRVVCLNAPLTPEQAAPLTDPQALTALTLYRPLEQAIFEDWGAQVEQVDALPPFRFIQCPLCSGVTGQPPSTFTTVGFTTLWCDRCSAQFSIRQTAGDPGFVVDCTWEHYQPAAANYLLPRTPDLQLTMVFKSGGDPLDLTHHAHCHRPDCTDEQVALTDGREGPLRAGLHACALGDVYDWSFYGRVPSVSSPDRYESHTLLWPDGRQETWPDTAFVRVTGVSPTERLSLAAAATLLADVGPDGSYRDDLVAFLREYACRPAHAPRLTYGRIWPPRHQLHGGEGAGQPDTEAKPAPGRERYLLHRWRLRPQGEDGLVGAVPVWLVVTEANPQSRSPVWKVIRDNICPHCGQAVGREAMTPTEPAPLWSLPHGYCRQTWAETN